MPARSAAIIDSVLDYDLASGRTATVAADRIVAMLRIMGWGLTGCSKRMSVPIICPLAPGRADRDWTLDQQRVFGTLFQMYADLARDGSAFDWLFEDGDRFGDLKAIVLHVPDHTALDLAYVMGNAAFVGDIFMPDYGTARADFPGGDPERSTGRSGGC
jgi:glyoxylase-like metal-dependent hydrolase (beta-lactamase superfamily II)